MKMKIPTRSEQLQKLRLDSFDLLVIGGGATGAGVALEAALRGLKVALVEANDFGSGTSSRSTKLIHGGLRYLEQAVKHADFSQFKLIAENLKERDTLLNIAPHLCHPLPMVIPIYRWIDLFYYYPGIKLYDWLAKTHKIGESHFIPAKQLFTQLPYLKRAGLKGGLIFFDGQFDDARMNVALALTAASQGVAVANHAKVIDLVKEAETIAGALVEDQLTHQRFIIKARFTVNATGPTADRIRQMDDPKAAIALRPSRGTHLILDGRYLPASIGLLIPKTSDGRLLFVLPWEGATLVGTTDIADSAETEPQPSREEVGYLLRHLSLVLEQPIEEKDIKAAWAGLRPLIAHPDISSTAALSRDHRIEVSPSRLYSIMGGKWSSYRKMAEELVDALPLNCGSCKSASTPLIGTEGYSAALSGELQCRFALPPDCAEHLAKAYGGLAVDVIPCGSPARLVEGFPYIQAEVVYAVQREYACTVEDILYRRTRLAFLDQRAAEAASPLVQKILKT